MKTQGKESRNATGFNDSPAAVRNLYNGLSPAARKRISTARRWQNTLARAASFFAQLPTTDYEPSAPNSGGSGGVPPQFMPKAPHLTGVLLSSELSMNAPIEGTVFSVWIELVNLQSGSLSGILRYSVDGIFPPAGGFTTYTVSQLASGAKINLELVVVAPRSALNHLLLLELTDNAKRTVIASYSITFDTAALYSLTLNSAHVYVPRAPLHDSVQAALYQCDGGQPTGTAVSYGDHGKGATIKIGLSFQFSQVPSTDPEIIGGYIISNEGGAQGRSDQVDANYYSIIFSVWWGGINSLANHDESLSSDYDAGVISFDPIFDLLWWIVEQAIGTKCNGVVAAQTIIVSGAQLDAQTLGGASIQQTVMCKGTKSPVGCGATSRYSVLWTINRLSTP